MRRFLAATLISSSLALSGFTAVCAEDAATNAPSEGSSQQSVADQGENSPANASASSNHSKKRIGLSKHLKNKIASKASRKTTDKAATGSTENTEKKSDETNKTSETSDTANTSASSGSTETNSSATSEDSGKQSKTAGKKVHHRRTARAASKTKLADSTPPVTPADPAKAAKKTHVNFAERLASTLVGTIVGTPVVIAKKSWSETVVATKDLVGDTDNWFLLAPAGLLGVPAGVLSGAFQGPVVASFTAWKKSADEPFSADAFSLGDGK